MSVVLDRPTTKTRPQELGVPLALRPRTPVEPLPRPSVDIPARTPAPTPVRNPARVRRHSGAFESVIAKCVLFGCIFGVTYVGSTLSGHYLVEKSRNQSNDASGRATVALQAEREVQRRIDVLTSASSIEDWALSHAFRPTDGLGETSKVVNVVETNQ